MENASGKEKKISIGGGSGKLTEDDQYFRCSQSPFKGQTLDTFRMCFRFVVGLNIKDYKKPRLTGHNIKKASQLFY